MAGSKLELMEGMLVPSGVYMPSRSGPPPSRSSLQSLSKSELSGMLLLLSMLLVTARPGAALVGISRLGGCLAPLLTAAPTSLASASSSASSGSSGVGSLGVRVPGAALDGGDRDEEDMESSLVEEAHGTEELRVCAGEPGASVATGDCRGEPAGLMLAAELKLSASSSFSGSVE